MERKSLDFIRLRVDIYNLLIFKTVDVVMTFLYMDECMSKEMQ